MYCVVMTLTVTVVVTRLPLQCHTQTVTSPKTLKGDQLVSAINNWAERNCDDSTAETKLFSLEKERGCTPNIFLTCKACQVEASDIEEGTLLKVCCSAPTIVLWVVIGALVLVVCAAPIVDILLRHVGCTKNAVGERTPLRRNQVAPAAELDHLDALPEDDQPPTPIQRAVEPPPPPITPRFDYEVPEADQQADSVTEQEKEHSAADKAANDISPEPDVSKTIKENSQQQSDLSCS